MKEKPKANSDKSPEMTQKLTSEEVWRMVERNLGYKLIPMKLSELDKNTKEK